MNLIAEIKYKKDDRKSDIQLMVIVTMIVASIFISLLFWTTGVTLSCLAVVLFGILFFGKKDGIVRFYEKDSMLEMSLLNKGKLEFQERITSYKFRWSYNYIITWNNNSGTPKGSHVNYIFTRAEFTLNNGKKIILGKELNQWKSAPTNWEYEVFEQTEDMFLGITNYDLTKLKTQMDMSIKLTG